MSSKFIFGKTTGKVYPGLDPHKVIAEKLLGEIPEGACVLVYNLAFENRVLRELGEGAELSRLRKSLLDYCRQDTQGLVRMVETMRAIR